MHQRSVEYNSASKSTNFASSRNHMSTDSTAIWFDTVESLERSSFARPALIWSITGTRVKWAWLPSYRSSKMVECVDLSGLMKKQELLTAKCYLPIRDKRDQTSAFAKPMTSTPSSWADRPEAQKFPWIRAFATTCWEEPGNRCLQCKERGSLWAAAIWEATFTS